MRGGQRRVQQPPPPGSLPPARVQLATKEGIALGLPLAIGLNRISGVLPVRGGKVTLHEVGPNGLDPDPWHTLSFPAKPAGLALLWRDPWDRAGTRD